MSKLTIFYKNANGDTFSLEIKRTLKLEKWLTQHPSDIYYLKTKEKDTYKIMRAAECLPALPKITATDEPMCELIFISGKDLANFLKQYKCSEYYLQLDQRVFVMQRV